MSRSGGFTVIELIVTIIIIGILSTLVVAVPTYFQKSSRDQERADDAASIARRLEQAYSAQEVGTPAYPSTTTLINDINAPGDPTGTLSRLKAEATRSPGSSSNSVIVATSTSATAPAGAGEPTISHYVYQPLTTSDPSAALCTGTSTCVRFNLYYRKESDNSVQIIKSVHQQ